MEINWLQDIIFTDLVAAIADGMVHLVAASSHPNPNMLGHFRATDSRLKSMLRMMTMSILAKACLAKIIVIACGAVKEIMLSKFYNR